MKITIKHHDTEIVYDESDNASSAKSYANHKQGLDQVIQLLEKLTEQVIKLTSDK